MTKGKIKERVLLAILLATVVTVVCSLMSNRLATWVEAPKPLRTGVQSPPPELPRSLDLGPVVTTDGIAGCFTPEVALAVECLERAPLCPYEDGDPSGWPCLWSDPGTGAVTYRDSREYW